MNHPHITSLHQLYQDETQPFRKVHRLIDLFECIIKTHTAVIIATYFKEKKVSDAVKGLLADGLKTPALGHWQLFSRIIQTEISKNETPSFIPAFQNEFEWLDKEIEGKNNIISFRNGYAHGATPSDDQCTQDIKKYEPFLEKLLTLTWLNESGIIISEDLVILSRKSDSDSLSLHPILVVRREYDKPEITFFNDLKDKDKVGLLNYSLAKHYKDKELYPLFMNVFPVKEWKTKSVSEFKQRIEELTDTFKGRVAEREQIHGWLQNHHKGFFCITGNPGIGKSALIAQVFKELNRKEIAGQYQLIEYFIRRGTQQSKPEIMLDYFLKTTGRIMKNSPAPASNNLVDKLSALNERLTEYGESEKVPTLLFIIDGLDEGIEDNILEFLPRQTFNNVLVMYGSRPGGDDKMQRFWTELPSEHKVFLGLRGLSKNDIRALLYEVVSKYEIERESEWITSVETRSQGNPLYLKLLCKSIEEEQIAPNDTSALPKGIEEFYKEFLDRYSRITPHGDALLQALYLFAAAKDYLTQHHLELVLGLGESTAQRVISTLSEILFENPKTEKVLDYQLFHESFREYLLSTKPSQLRDAVKKLVAFGNEWKSIKGKFEQRYALQHQSTHLSSLGEKESDYSSQLTRLAKDAAYQNEQKKVLRNFNATQKLLGEALNISCFQNDTDNSIEFATALIIQHAEEQNSFDEIFQILKEGDIENVLQRIASFYGPDEEQKKIQFILYMLCLQALTLGELKEHLDRKEMCRRILDHLNENVIIDHTILDWDRFYPRNLMYNIAVELSNLDLSHIELIERTSLNITSIENIISESNNSSSEVSSVSFIDNWDDPRGYVPKTSPCYDKTMDFTSCYPYLLKQGKNEEADKTLNETLNDAFKFNCYYSVELISDILEAHGKHELAIGILKVALDLALLEQKDDFMPVDKYFRVIRVFERLSKRGLQEDAQNVLDTVLHLTSEIDSEDDKSSVFSAIAMTLAEFGRYNEAFELTNEISEYCTLKEDAVLGIFNLILAKLGNDLVIENTLEETLQLASKIEEKRIKSVVYKNITKTLVDLGKFQDSGNAMKRYLDFKFKKYQWTSYGKVYWMAEISEILFKQGHKEKAYRTILQAEKVAILETVDHIKVEELAIISGSLSNQCRYEESDRTIKEAINTISLIKDMDRKYFALDAVARYMAKRGKHEDAKSFVVQNSWVGNQIKSLNNISRDLLSLGKQEEAEKYLKEAVSLSYDEYHDQDQYPPSEVGDLFEILIENNKFDKALKIASIVPKGSEECMMSAIVSLYLEDQGNQKEAEDAMKNALNIASDITDEEEKSTCFSIISIILKEQNKSKEAKEISSNITNEDGKINATGYIAPILAERGKHSEALNLASQIIDEEEKSKAFKTISGTMAANGKFVEAIHTALQVTQGLDRIATYKELAGIWANKNSIADINRFLERLPNQEARDAWLLGLAVSLKYNGNKVEELTNLLSTCKDIPEAIKIILEKIAAQICFFEANQNRVQLNKIDTVVDIKHFLDCLPVENNYALDNIKEWIEIIEDEDDREDIKDWAKKVQNGEMSPAKFDERVRKRLKPNP